MQGIFNLYIIIFLTSVSSIHGEALSGSRVIPDTFWGTTTHVNTDWVVSSMKDLGLTCARIDFVHEALEPSENIYALNDGSWCIKSAELGLKEKIDLLPVVSIYNTCDRVEKNPAAFEKFVYEVASKYRGKIRYWEAWNEPDMTIIGKKYVTMLKAFYKGIKKADPENKVVLAGMAGDEAANFEMVYTLGGKDYFDIVNSHSYTRPLSPEEGGYVQKIKNLHEVMKKYGDNKPCWVTEVGWNAVESSMLDYLKSKSESHRNNSCTEEEGARYLARVYMLSASIPWIERVYFYNLQIDPPYSDIRMANADDYINIYQSWVNHQIAPKIGYYSLKTVIKMLKGSTYREQLNLGKRIYGMVFTRTDEGMIALWSLDENVVLTIQGASVIQSITSMVGTPILVTADLKLSGRPIYIKTTLKNLDSLKKQILSAHIQGMPAYSLSVSSDTEKSTPDEPVVLLSVTNNSPSTQEAPVANVQVQSPWRLKNSVQKDTLPFKGNETRYYRLPVKGPETNRSGEINFDVDARISNVEPIIQASKCVRYAVFFPSPKCCSPISLGLSPDQRDMRDWQGPRDCSATWYCMWDQQNLYINADVADNAHFQKYPVQKSGWIWDADGIQVAIDLAGDAQACSNVPQYDGKNDVEFGLALGCDGPIFHIWTNPNGKTGLAKLENISIVRDENKKITHYKAAIPWSVLGWTENVAGRWMGFNLIVNDNDGTGRKGCIMWSEGINRAKDPSKFNKILLSRKSN